jgi:hypothetical protein
MIDGHNRDCECIVCTLARHLDPRERTTIHHEVGSESLNDVPDDGTSILWIEAGRMSPDALRVVSHLWMGIAAFVAAQDTVFEEPEIGELHKTLFEEGLNLQNDKTSRVVSKVVVALVKALLAAIDSEIDEPASRVVEEVEQEAWEEFTPESVIQQAEEIIRQDDLQS